MAKRKKNVFDKGHDFELKLYPLGGERTSVKLDGKELSLVTRVEVMMDADHNLPTVTITMYARSLLVDGKTTNLTMKRKA